MNIEILDWTEDWQQVARDEDMRFQARLEALRLSVLYDIPIERAKDLVLTLVNAGRLEIKMHRLEPPL